MRLLIVFQLTLLNEVGTKPVLARCANCKTPFSDGWPHYYFSSIGNGLICPDCEFSFADKIRINPDIKVPVVDPKAKLVAFFFFWTTPVISAIGSVDT